MLAEGFEIYGFGDTGIAASLKDAGITDPADHFKGKMIRATGTVKEVDGVPRIEIDASEQIKVVEK